MKTDVHVTTRLRKKTTRTCTLRKSIDDLHPVGRIHLNSCGKNGPMKQRLDYAEAVRIIERLYRESEGPNEKIHPSRQTRQTNNQSFSRSDEGTERIDAKTRWNWYSTSTSSSCSSWWVAPESWWTSSCWEEQLVFLYFLKHFYRILFPGTGDSL